MNCHDFEIIVGDLSKDVLMDAGLREKGLEHSASCADCAARVDEERVLTGGLRLLAQTSSEEAPSSVESAVLAAFRQHRIESPVPVATRKSYRRWIYASVSAAALALIAPLLALNASRTPKPQLLSPQGAADIETPAKPDVFKPDASNALPASPQMASGGRHLVGKKLALRGQHKEILRQKSLQDDTGNTVITEITTDFIPLTNWETLAQMDGGQVMRVELPRSALMSFGLPMDMERATERIKADVVVGNDGLARAIRFVR
jgi:hypothetical protein